MSEGLRKPREFEIVTDLDEALSLIRESAKLTASTFLWTKNQEITVATHLLSFNEERYHVTVWQPPDVDPVQFMKTLTRLGSLECFFSVSLGRANVFFRTRYLGTNKEGMRFRKPSQVFKVQRRKNARFFIPEGLSLLVQFESPADAIPPKPRPILEKKILDLSAGGLAFSIDDAEAPAFKVGQNLVKMKFVLKDHIIETIGEIRHIKAFPSNSRNKGVKIGVLFKNLRPDLEHFIAAVVFEETRKYYTKFI